MGRLNAKIKPVNYNIELDVDLKKFEFKGREIIKVNVGGNSDKIVVNSADLKIKKCSINGGSVNFNNDEKKEELTLNLKEKILGEAEVEIEFSGILSEGLAGFYRSKYNVNGKEKYLATTQFEPADARRAFPCFDEPSMKSTFDITLIFDKGLSAISNMPEKENEDVENKKRVVFDTTPIMSTYLVYLGIGEFEFLEDKIGETALRIITTPGKKEQGKFAMECTKKFLQYYNDYFGIPYALPRLDQIAIPDFASGAMENWGAITYREIELLFDEKVNSRAMKHRVAEVIAHEISHQWFGNLVTMEWWNDLWLNESFATWISYKVVDHFFPEFDMWSSFVSDEVEVAMALDSLKSSHAIKADVKEPHEVNNIFDAISYNKGGSILRMLEDYLGEDIFRDGLRAYMEKHKFANAEAVDLWGALGDVSKDTDVKKMMVSWINNVGYPVVEVEISGKELKLRQKRFLFEKDKEEGSWMLPIKVKLDSGKEISFLMNEKEKKIDLGKEVDYVSVNDGRNAFYRVKYDKDDLSKLKDLISNGKLDELNRWGLQNDLYALSKSGEITFEEYLNFLDAYKNEKHYLICGDIIGNLAGVYLISSGKLKEKVKEFATEFCNNVLAWLKWEGKAKENENYAILRSSVLAFLGRMDDVEVLEEGKKRFDEFLKNPGNLNPDLKGAVYSIAAWQGGDSEYEKFKELYLKSEVAEDGRKFLIALGGFSDESKLNKTLDFALSKDVRSQDAYMPVLSVARNSKGKELAWQWVKRNWKELEKRYGFGGNVKMFETFVIPIGVLSDINKEKEIKEFFDKQKSAYMIQKQLTQSLERLRVNYNFLKKNE